MNIPALNLPLNNSGGPFLGTPGSGGGSAGFDAEVIPVVQVAPVYPRAAKQGKIEGAVTLRITIRADGTVAQATVIDATPKRLFDEAAKQAILRWKFRPKVVDGQAVAQEATQVIEFSLSKAS
jgi:protein TonB